MPRTKSSKKSEETAELRGLYDDVRPRRIKGWVYKVYYTEDRFRSCTVIARNVKEAIEIAELAHPKASVESVHEQDRAHFYSGEKPLPDEILFAAAAVEPE